MKTKTMELVALCERFIETQRIYGPETIYQADRVIVNAYEFIEKMCNIVGYLERDDD